MYKRALAALGIAAAATTALAVPAASARSTTSLTIADVLLADDQGSGQANVLDRNWRDYDIVTAAVLLPGNEDLVAAASDPTAALTVLAPDDRAFRTFAQNLTKKRLHSEQAVVDALLAIEASAPGTVRTVLAYHIVGAKLSPAAVLDSDHVAVTTLQGGSFTVDVKNKKVAFVQFVDNDRNDRSPFLNRINVGGGELANGFVHGIDKVLRPLDL